MNLEIMTDEDRLDKLLEKCAKMSDRLEEGGVSKDDLSLLLIPGLELMHKSLEDKVNEGNGEEVN